MVQEIDGRSGIHNWDTQSRGHTSVAFTILWQQVIPHISWLHALVKSALSQWAANYLKLGNGTCVVGNRTY